MALAGKGAIVIWNDIAPEGRAAFYDWHNNEHLPERLGIPGFLRGSRYLATTPATTPEWLTLYELRDRAVATSDAYLARLNAPTTWSRSTMLHFRNMIRALTDVTASHGAVHGGIAASIRFDGTDAGMAALQAVRNQSALLAELAALPRIAGVHLCLTDAAASAAKTAESRHRGDSIPAPIGVILIEGCDKAAVEAAVAHCLRAVRIDAGAATIGIYALEATHMPPVISD